MANRRGLRSPSDEGYQTQQRELQREVRARYSTSDWNALLEPMAQMVRRSAAGDDSRTAVAVPSGLDPDLKVPWETLRSAIAERRDLGVLGAPTFVLNERLTTLLAEEGPTGPTQWQAIAQVLGRVGEVPYVEAIPLEQVAAHEDALIDIVTTADPISVLHTFGRLRASTEAGAFLSELIARRGVLRDLWLWLEEVSHLAGSCTFSEPFWISVHLLGRLGGTPWLRFLRRLPSALHRQIALRQISSPEDTLDLLGLIVESPSESDDLDAEIGTLLLRHLFGLWNNTLVDLSHAAAARAYDPALYPDFHKGALSAEKDWKDRYLPECAQALATAMLSACRPIGFSISILALRHLWSTGADPSREPNSFTAPIVRGALISALAQSTRSLDDFVRELLAAKPTDPGVLAACLVTIERKGEGALGALKQFHAIWQCRVEMFSRDAHARLSLVGDGFELAKALASTLARLESPPVELERAIQRVHRSGEGWKSDYKGFLASISSVADLFTVGAIACEFLKTGGQPSQPLFEVVWSRLHSWIRNVPEPIGDQEIRSALVNTWARLQLVEGVLNVPRIISTLKRIDRLDWILDAAKHLQLNQPTTPSELPPEIQSAIRDMYDDLFPSFSLRHNVTSELAAQCQAMASGLTPAVPRNDMEPVSG